MSVVLTALFPVFALIAIGWLLGRTGVLNASASHSLTRFVALVCLPALLFDISRRHPWQDIVHVGVLMSFGVPMLLCFGLGFWWRCRQSASRSAAALAGMNASYANTGFMGIPLLSLLIGEEALAPAVTTTLLTATILFSLTILILNNTHTTSSTQAKRPFRALLRLGTNPLVFAPLAGVISSAWAIPLPEALQTVITLLAAPATPTALIAIGLFLATLPAAAPSASAHPSAQQAQHLLRQRSGFLGLKLLLQPLLTGLLAYYVVGLTPVWAFAVTVLSATPLGTGPFMLASIYQQDLRESSALILWSTVLSALTLAALVQVLPMA